ncbi:MAG: hypothetical protein R3F02_12805 [Thiolinea sp.]
MTRAQFYPLFLCLPLFLSACGEDVGSYAITSDPAAVAYNGSHNPALLTQDNAMLFVEKLLGSNDLLPGFNVLKSTSPAERPERGMVELLNLLMGKVKLGYQGFDYQQRQVSLDGGGSCEYGGSLSETGSVDRISGKGRTIYQFIDCQLGQDLTINGMLTLDIRAYDFAVYGPISYIASFNDLEVKEKDATTALTGSVDRIFNTNTLVATRTMNVYAEEVATGTQSMLENFTFTNTLGREYAGMSGVLYLGNYGYARIASSDDLILGESISGNYLWGDKYNLHVLPLEGELILQGAARSAVKVTGSDIAPGSAYRVALDEDGDGTYELKSVRLPVSGSVNEFVANGKPVSSIGYLGVLTSSGYFALENSITLDALLSFDPDGGSLTYNWTVEQKPSGSLVEVMCAYTCSRQVQTTPLDKPGTYKFSLKVTDEQGLSAISFLEISAI